MPTVLLVDVSISLARPVVGAERTRKELVQRGLLHFIQHLEEHHPLELTSLITFSSEAKVIVPFTKDYTKLRTSLTEHLKLRDKTSLDSGLETVVRHVQETFFHPSSPLNSPIGITSQVQIIVVTDGRSNGRLSPLSIEIPFPVKMQIVALGQRSELNLEELQHLTKIHNGILRFIELPQGARLFKKTFEEIAHENYAPYSGSIACGHLLSRVQLHPDPNLILSHYLSCNSDLPTRIPEVLTILGFVHSKNISSPPTLSRHAVLPASLPLHDNAMDTSPSTNNSENILCILLHQCLKAEKAFAVVQLDSSGQWYGLLSSLTEQERTGLVFSFLPPRLSLPWMGDFSAVFYPPLFEPTRMGAYRSYSAPPKGLTALPSLRPEILSTDCQKILRYASNLPGKADLMYSECRQMKNTSVVFSMPSLLDGIGDILSDLATGPDDDENSNIIRKLVQELTHKPQRPADPNVYSPKPKEQRPPSSTASSTSRAMSVNNLLN